MIRTCVHCNEEFDDKIPHNKKGKINECGECAVEPAVRYVAISDAACKAGAGLNIFRSPTQIRIASSVIKAQNKAGFNANLGLGSTVSTFGQSEDC